MLDQMRKQAQSAIVLLLFGFIIFVFVFSFGAGSVGFRTGGCGQSNAAAIVNGQTIGLGTYRFVYQQALQQMMRNRREGQPISRQEKLELNERVLNQLINKELVLQAARKLGLRVTDEERNEAIRDNPSFWDKNKKFDFKLYKRIVMYYYKTTMSVFEEIYRQDMLYQRMADIIMASARVTNEELENAYRLRETKVDLEFVRLSPAQFRAAVQPSEAEVQAYLADHGKEIEQYYQEHESRYHTPKKVQVAQAFWEVESDWPEDRINDKKERADLSLEDLKSGADFTEQVKEYSEDRKTKDEGGKLPLMDMETMSARYGAPFAEAAFALKEGELSKVVRSDKGFYIIKVLKIEPAVDHSLDEVKQDIARQLLIDQQAEQMAKQEAERLLTGVEQGKNLEALLTEQRAAAKPAEAKVLERIKAQQTGLTARMGGYLPQLGLDRDLARAAFELTPEHPYPNKVWEVSGGPFGAKSYVVFRLIKRQEPDMSRFPEAKEQLREQLLASRRQRQLTSWLDRQRESATIEINQSLRSNPNPLAYQGRGGPGGGY